MSKVIHKGEGDLPYAIAVQAGDFLFLSGHLAWGDDGELIHAGIEEETRRVWKNIEKTLKNLGCALGDVVKATIWLQDTRDFNGYNKAYREVFPHDAPARSTVRADLMFDCKIEVEVVVYKPPQ